METPQNIKPNPVVKYFAESKSELQKVSWPSRNTVVNHTILVVVMSLGLAAFIGVVDYGLNALVQLIIK